MLSLLTSSLFLATAVAAVTPVSDSDMTTLLNEGGVGLALKSQPMWFFGQSLDVQPCIPTFATTDDGQQVNSSTLCDWPDTGCDCRNPGVDIGNPAPSFPTYFTYDECNSTEIRVAYNLFYTKDGVNPDDIFGHPYDWERVVVVWEKGDDTNWTASQLFLSQHSGYQKLDWASIQNTFSDDTASDPRGGDNGMTDLDHPKVYVASYKHDNHDDRNTGYNDALSQLTDNAFRSQDWWYFPTEGDYILADNSTDIGNLIASFDWGSATSNPVEVQGGLCTS